MAAKGRARPRRRVGIRDRRRQAEPDERSDRRDRPIQRWRARRSESAENDDPRERCKRRSTHRNSCLNLRRIRIVPLPDRAHSQPVFRTQDDVHRFVWRVENLPYPLVPQKPSRFRARALASLLARAPIRKPTLSLPTTRSSNLCFELRTRSTREPGVAPMYYIRAQFSYHVVRQLEVLQTLGRACAGSQGGAPGGCEHRHCLRAVRGDSHSTGAQSPCVRLQAYKGE